MGLILPQKVKINISSKNVKHFESKGYNIPIKPASKSYKTIYHKDFIYMMGAEIDVDVEDLFPSSRVNVDCVCDFCNKKLTISYLEYNKRINNSISGNIACKDCVKELIKKNNLIKYNVEHTLQVKDFREQIKLTMMEKYGVENPGQSKIIKDKIKQTIKNKYGVDNISQSEEIKNKKSSTLFNNYGVTNPMYSEIIKERCIHTNLTKYGVNYPSQNKDIQNKIRNSLYGNDNIPTSKQQIYVNNLYEGLLNYPLGNYSGDIVLEKDKIDIEIDFGGHNLQIKLGTISEEQFNQSEIIRHNIIKRLGFKQIHIISRKDYLPSDEILLQMLEISKQYFNSTNHTWINWDIDEGKYFNAERLDGVLFNFGELRKLPKTA